MDICVPVESSYLLLSPHLCYDMIYTFFSTSNFQGMNTEHPDSVSLALKSHDSEITLHFSCFRLFINIPSILGWQQRENRL